MALKKTQGVGERDLGSIGDDAELPGKPVQPPARIGRPKQNPYAEDKKLTIRVPADVHRKLRYASVDLDKPMVEIAVDALISYLEKHEA